MGKVLAPAKMASQSKSSYEHWAMEEYFRSYTTLEGR